MTEASRAAKAGSNDEQLRMWAVEQIVKINAPHVVSVAEVAKQAGDLMEFVRPSAKG